MRLVLLTAVLLTTGCVTGPAPVRTPTPSYEVPANAPECVRSFVAFLRSEPRTESRWPSAKLPNDPRWFERERERLGGREAVLVTLRAPLNDESTVQLLSVGVSAAQLEDHLARQRGALLPESERNTPTLQLAVAIDQLGCLAELSVVQAVKVEWTPPEFINKPD